MPFQSEAQRRYLWANEPEIARDWTDTYGSRIESNTGGISRLGFANGPNWQVDPNTVNQALLDEQSSDYQGEEEENPLEKFLRYMQGNAGQLSHADIIANKNFLGNMKFSPNNPYAMTSGLFKGKNAPGSSAFGSKNPKEMAQKWMEKFGGVDHTSSAMQEKKDQMRQTAGYAPHHSYSSGGISRLGYLYGGMSHPGGRRGFPGGAGREDYSPMGTTSSGALSSGANYGAPGTGDGQHVKTKTVHSPEEKPDYVGKGLSGLSKIVPFITDPKKANMFGLSLEIINMLKNKDKVSQEDMIYGTNEKQTSTAFQNFLGSQGLTINDLNLYNYPGLQQEFQNSQTGNLFT